MATWYTIKAQFLQFYTCILLNCSCTYLQNISWCNDCNAFNSRRFASFRDPSLIINFCCICWDFSFSIQDIIDVLLHETLKLPFTCYCAIVFMSIVHQNVENCKKITLQFKPSATSLIWRKCATLTKKKQSNANKWQHSSKIQ